MVSLYPCVLQCFWLNAFQNMTEYNNNLASTKSVIEELVQFHKLNVLNPCEADKLSREEKNGSME